MNLPSLSTCPHCPGSSRVFSAHGLKVHIGRVHKHALSSGAVSQVSPVNTVNTPSSGQATPAHSPAQSSLDRLAGFKASIPVLRHIPKGARNQAAGKLCDIIDSCVASNGVDEWSALFSFAYTALRVPAKELPGNVTSKVKANIMSSVHRHDSELDACRRSGSRSIKKSIETRVFEGDLRGAVRLLMSDDSFARGDADTLTSLKLKHPDPSRPHSFPPDPDPALAALSVTVEDVMSALGSFYAGSAAGLDGIRPGHLKELTSVSAGENGKRLVGCLTRLANFLLGGQVDPRVCPYLYGTSLFALTKKDGGVRPIENMQSLGNHEFDEAVDGVVPFIRNLSSPVVAANLMLDKVPELQNEKNLFKSIVIVKDNVKIGIIGYLTPKTKEVAPRNDVEYEDEVPAIRREVKKLKEQDVNILIALGHSGFVKDLEIAREVEDIDLVIGGHSNTFLWNADSTSEKPEVPEGPYPTEVKQADGRIVRVVQAYAYTKYMGKLYLVFDSAGEIIKCEGTPILLNQEIPRDPELLETVDKYRKDMDRINNEVVGSSLVYLNENGCRLRECNLGDLIADAMLNYTREEHHEQYPDVNIALVQGGRIRTAIYHEGKPFNITRGDLINVLPFSDSLTILTMNGTVLKQSLEHSVSTWRTIDSTGQFQQFSGMEVTYDLARPAGSRVVRAKAVCSNCGVYKLQDIKDDYEYKMMMPTFLADGGDGYSMFINLPRKTVLYSELDSILYYLKKYSPVDKQVDGRISVLNEDKVKSTEFTSDIKNESLKHSNAAMKYSLNWYCVLTILFLCQY